jgi:hypothetical protein
VEPHDLLVGEMKIRDDEPGGRKQFAEIVLDLGDNSRDFFHLPA